MSNSISSVSARERNGKIHCFAIRSVAMGKIRCLVISDKLFEICNFDFFLMKSRGYSVFSNITEKHTLNSILSYPPSHRHYCTKHQPPLLLQHVVISIRNIFARDDTYVHADVGGFTRFMAC